MQLKDNIELLRRLIENQQGQAISYEEAASIGSSLITFYEILGAEEIKEDEQ